MRERTVNISTLNYERSLRPSDSNRPKKTNKAATPSAPLPKLTATSCGLSVAGLGGSGADMVGDKTGVKVAWMVASANEVEVDVKTGTAVDVEAGVTVGVEVAVSAGE